MIRIIPYTNISQNPIQTPIHPILKKYFSTPLDFSPFCCIFMAAKPFFDLSQQNITQNITVLYARLANGYAGATSRSSLLVSTATRNPVSASACSLAIFN
jgi:hypothetical protein